MTLMSTTKTTYTMILCGLITQRCEGKGIAQKDLFLRSGIATGTWSRMTRGLAHFQVEDLRSACRVLEWTVGELTAQADRMADDLEKKERVTLVTKEDLKSLDSSVGSMIAVAALAFLLLRLSD